jgi:hypothetical protein
LLRHAVGLLLKLIAARTHHERPLERRRNSIGMRDPPLQKLRHRLVPNGALQIPYITRAQL